MRHYRLGLVTWNVGGAPPGVAYGTSSILQVVKNCDVIVVGLQEVSVGRRGWKAELRKALGSEWAYIGGESYAGMRVKVFARLSREKPPFPEVQVSALSAQDAAKVGLNVRAGKFPVASINGAGKRVGVGVADRWPNKGAVAVEIKFGHACRVLFIVAHLAANEQRVQGREDDWRAILRRLDKDDMPLTRGTEPCITVPLFHRYEHVFVLGDLNYRIAPPGTDHGSRVAWVQDLVKRKQWDQLVDADQLTRERAGGKVFANFQEGDISFAPTFKTIPGGVGYSGNRIPSYCDRILWHSLPARIDLVKCAKYTSLPEFNASDHIPVYAQFDLKVPPFHTLCPRKTLNPFHGKRIVLEFMLVRFVKGPGNFAQQDASSDGPPSFRHIEPAFLNRGNQSPVTDRDGRLVTATEGPSEGGLGVYENGDEQEDVYDEEEEYDDEGSSMSSEGEENYWPNDIMNGNWDRGPLQRYEISHHRIFRRNATLGNISVPRDDRFGLPDRDLRVLSPKSSEDSSADSPSGVQNGEVEMRGRVGMSTPSPLKRSSPRPHANSGPRRRDSLSRQLVDEGTLQGRRMGRRRLNSMRMEVHGEGLFLKQGRVYSVGIPKRANGERERIGECLPVIPLAPIVDLRDLDYRHVLIEFAKKNSRVGTSGALPLRELVKHAGEPYAFELSLTKYGLPIGVLEACVQLTVSDTQYWVDAKGRVVRNSDGGPSKTYTGPLSVRKRTMARSKPKSFKRN